MLDHYRVVSALGAGGMGEVYLAKDEQLGREVALKVLSREDAGEEAVRARLLHEARLASALNHPNICTIHHVGATGAQAFIVMEYVSGRTLAETLLAGPLASEQALAYALEIADALEHAHARGVIHRDLKCANVIVSTGQRVKVLDFGLAKRMDTGALDAATMSAASLSGQGAIVGTLPYMAPEILRGAEATATSDVWAFGIVLYEMLAGKPPFQGQSAYDLTTSIMRDEPKPVPNRLPPGISNILKRCLSKDPSQRYANGGELRAALQAATAGVAVKGPKAHASWAVRAGLAMGAIVIAALCVWGSLRLLHRPHTGPDSIAVLPFSNENGGSENEYLTEGLTDDLIEGLGRLPNLKVSPRTSVFRYKGRPVSASDVGRELGVKAVLKGAVKVQDGGIAVDAELVDSNSLKRLWSGHYARALTESAALKETLLREITAELEGKAASGATSGSPGTARNNDAYQAHLKGLYHLYKHTPEELEQARQYFEQSLAADPTYAPAYAGLSSYYSLLADNGLAAPASTLPKARAAAQKALQIDPHVTMAPNTLAYTKMVHDWDFRGAEADFRNLIAAQPNVPDNYIIFAICLRILGKTDEAIESGRKGLALDPLNVENGAGHAWNFYFAHRFDEAISQFRDILVLDPSYAAAHFGLALSYQQKRSEEQAAAEFEKYLSATAGEESVSEFRKTYRVGGYKAAVRGLWKLQLDVLRQRAQQEYVSPMLFASTYALLNDKEQAFKWLDKAMDERSVKLLDLKVDPDFDSLRGDPRFSQLTHKIGLP